MTSARYGRMRLGRCVRVDFGFIGCSTDVIQILDRQCSGRSECRLRIPDAEMDETRPCLNDLTRYLSASYQCVAGELPLLGRIEVCTGSLALMGVLPSWHTAIMTIILSLSLENRHSDFPLLSAGMGIGKVIWERERKREWELLDGNGSE